jgi:ATP-dependent Clp protease ATP-binding subunit ClpA
MIFRRFVDDSRRVAQRARAIAAENGSRTVESEHLVLAVTHSGPGPWRRLLAEAGLEHELLVQALDAELEASLAAVGVALGHFELTSTPDPERVPRWGESAKLALSRAARLAAGRRDRSLTPGHIVVGALRARAGTLVRALDLAGLDRVALAARVEAAL